MAVVGALARVDLGNFMVASTPGGIESQEKQGQLAQAARQTLQVEGTSEPDQRKTFESIGFRFGKQSEDPLFVEATFPNGWHKVLTKHAVWSDLVDDKGRKRGSIFYKAAFYDQSASVTLARRFRVVINYPEGRGDTEVFVRDGSNGEKLQLVLTETPDRASPTSLSARRKIEDIDNQLEEWLDECWPNWGTQQSIGMPPAVDRLKRVVLLSPKVW